MRDKNNQTLEQGWRIVKFGDVVTQVKDRVADAMTSGHAHYVRGEDFVPAQIRLGSRSELGDGQHGPAFHMQFKKGDVLYVSRNPRLRKAAVADFDGICANTTYVCRSDTNLLLQELLPFIMQTEGFSEYAKRHQRGSTNFYVNWSDIAPYEFKLPPLEKQKSAVAVLRAAADHCYAIEDVYVATRRMLQALKDSLLVIDDSELAKSYLLGDLLLGSPESGCSAPPKDATTGYFVLGLAALSREGYVSGDFKPVERTSKMVAAKLSPGDMLISRSNTVDRVGYVGIFSDNRNDVSFPDTMMRLRPNPAMVRPDYLEALLQTTSAREFLMRIAAGTSASMKKINRANLLQMRLNVPSLDAQDSILSQLRALKKAMTGQKARLETAQQLAKLIAIKTFGGAA